MIASNILLVLDGKMEFLRETVVVVSAPPPAAMVGAIGVACAADEEALLGMTSLRSHGSRLDAAV